MYLLLKKIVLFSLPLIILSFLFDYLISSGLKKSDYFAQGETYIWSEIFNGRVNSELYIYGSSRAWVHFDSQMLEDSLGLNTYNFGIDGHNFWLQYLRHKMLLKYNSKPKIILLSVGNLSFTETNGFYNSKQFLPFVFDSDIREFTSKYNGFNWIEYHIPLIRYFGKTKDIHEAFRNKEMPYFGELFRKKGFRAVPRIWNTDLKKLKSKINQYEIKVNSSYQDLMDDFIKECMALDIDVIMINSPEYIEGQKFIKNRDEIISFYRKLSSKYELSFLDYSENNICLDRDLFYNSQHLNGNGAKIFTKILIADLKKMKLFKSQTH